jgi:hypothetical protein
MENELNNINSFLEQSLASIQHKYGSRIAGLFATHNSGTILDQNDSVLYEKCMTAVDLLNQVQQTLTPPLFTLVDAFFGKYMQ